MGDLFKRDYMFERFPWLTWPRLLGALALLAALAVPLLTTNTFYLRKFAIMGILVIAAQGLNLLAGFSGQVSLGHAGFYAIGAYTAGVLQVMGYNFWAALAAAVLLAAAAGGLVGLPALRVKGHYLAMVTIGFGVIVYKIALEWAAVTGGFNGLQGVPRPAPFGTPLSMRGTYLLVLLLVLLTVWLVHNLLHSRPGRALRAIHDGDVAAEAMGIWVARYKITAFMLSGGFTGLAGAMFAGVFNYVSPDSFHLAESVMLLVMVIIGGMGSISGPIMGVVLLDYVGKSLHWMRDYRLVTYGMLMLGFMILKPGGLVELFPAEWRRSRRDTLRTTGGEAELEELLRQRAPANGEAVPLLQVRSVSKFFGGLVALDRVEITVRQGALHALIGPNGSGKTTLLHTISGIYRADAGSIWLAGRDIGHMPAHRFANLGMTRTFQHSQVFGPMTALDNVVVGQHRWRHTGLFGAMLTLPGARREEAQSRELALRILTYCGLAERAYYPAGGLPTGMQRLLEIARALAARPRLLLLDEPAAGLTQSEIELLEQMLLRLKALGITVVLVEHDMRLVMKVSDYVTVLDSGKVISEGPPAHVQADPRVIAAYLGEEGRAAG